MVYWGQGRHQAQAIRTQVLELIDDKVPVSVIYNYYRKGGHISMSRGTFYKHVSGFKEERAQKLQRDDCPTPKQRDEEMDEDELDAIALEEARADDDGTRYPFEIIIRLSKGEHPIGVYRDFHAMTQADLARKVGIAEADLAMFEDGKRVLPDDLAEKIASALDVDPEDLVPCSA